MSDVVLTAYSGAILGPIAKFLGMIMNAIYSALYHLFGIESVILSIIIITIIIYMLLLPLTIKQQKFSKLQQAMQPEIKKIQEKYQGKKDEASIRAMNEETQAVYNKYGVSATGSCVQMLIQFPILLALYRVFYNIPAYIGSVKSNFTDLASGIKGVSGYQDTLATLMKDYNFSTYSGLRTDNVVEKLNSASGSDVNNYIIDIIYKLPSNGWKSLSDYFPTLSDSITSSFGHLKNFNYFLGMNISDTPLTIIKTSFTGHHYGYLILALLIPICSYLSQVLSLKMMPKADASATNDQMAQQMKTMNTIMPIFSFVFCFSVPVALGFYWTCTALIRTIQQFFINRHIQNLNLDDIIAKNEEKARKKREKMGIAENEIRNHASLNTKSSSSSNANSKYGRNTIKDHSAELEAADKIKANARPGSLAAKANKVREFNEKNSSK